MTGDDVRKFRRRLELTRLEFGKLCDYGERTIYDHEHLAELPLSLEFMYKGMQEHYDTFVMLVEDLHIIVNALVLAQVLASYMSEGDFSANDKALETTQRYL